MIVIDGIELNGGGKVVNYNYRYADDLKKYFTNVPFYITYDVDVSSVPVSILNIPLIANLLPISWFVGFDIEVAELDRVFYHQVEKLKKQFEEYHPLIKTKASSLIVKHLTDPSPFSSNKKAMLYSGGADAYATLLRHFDEVPDLLSIQGVDMALGDELQWKGLQSLNDSTDIIKPNNKFYIVSSLRKFISSKVNRLIEGGDWYGTVQHGLAITALTAPLAYLHQYSTVYIASSFDRKEGYSFFLWGSLPEIDNLIKFNNTSISHDGTELTRQEKISYIVDWATRNHEKIHLRVCYSTKTSALNCNRCSKCLMTIFAILNANQDPNKFGFDVDLNIFGQLKTFLKKGFASPAKMFFWKEVYQASLTANRFNNDQDGWKKAYREIDLIFPTSFSKPYKEPSWVEKIKMKWMRKFHQLFSVYKKMRSKL